VASGSVSIDINVLNEQVSQSTEFGSKQTTFNIGTEDIPLPIKMKMKPIYRALEQVYWGNLPGGATYSSLRIATKKTHLEKAFSDYKSSRGSLSSGNYS